MKFKLVNYIISPIKISPQIIHHTIRLEQNDLCKENTAYTPVIFSDVNLHLLISQHNFITFYREIKYITPCMVYYEAFRRVFAQLSMPRARAPSALLVRPGAAFHAELSGKLIFFLFFISYLSHSRLCKHICVCEQPFFQIFFANICPSV